MKKEAVPQKSGRKFTIKLIGVAQRFYKILVAGIGTLFSLNVIAQGNTEKISLNATNYSLTSANKRSLRASAIDKIPSRFLLSKTVSADHYTKGFGFFCRKELQLEKRTGIPLRFRLGSLGYCNSIEYGGRK